MPADELSHRRPEGSRGRSRPAETSSGERTGGAEPAPGVVRSDASGAHALRFRRSHRLLERRDFDRVLGGGRRRSSPELVVVTSPPGLRGRLREPGQPEGVLRSRLGITVGRKAGSSVERNRFKRRVREWFRHERESLGAPLDIVVIARRPAVSLSLEELSQRLARLLASSRSQMPGKTQENPKA